MIFQKKTCTVNKTLEVENIILPHRAQKDSELMKQEKKKK